jgi:hypothetical protein
MNSFLGEWRSKRKGPNRHNSQTDHTPNEIRIFFIFFIKALIKSQYSTHQHENKIFCKKKKKKKWKSYTPRKINRLIIQNKVSIFDGEERV